MNDSKIYPFNNNVDTGLRMLTILTTSYPESYDLDHLIYFDYMLVHSGDIDNQITSLHPAVPNRTGEIFIRRNLIQDSLEIFIKKGLLERVYNKNGIEYRASENSMPFLDSLSEEYTSHLLNRAEWLIENYGSISIIEIKQIFANNLSKLKGEFNLEII